MQSFYKSMTSVIKKIKSDIKLYGFWIWVTEPYYRFTGWTPIYWLRTHLVPGHRYHIVNLKKTPYPYNWGWLDRDEAILIASFRLLQDFIEKENHGFDSPERQEILCKDDHFNFSERAKAELEILDLYDWWMNKRPTQIEQGDAEWLNFGQPKEDNEKLHRLIELRGYLWT